MSRLEVGHPAVDFFGQNLEGPITPKQPFREYPLGPKARRLFFRTFFRIGFL